MRNKKDRALGSKEVVIGKKNRQLRNSYADDMVFKMAELNHKGTILPMMLHVYRRKSFRRTNFIGIRILA